MPHDHNSAYWNEADGIAWSDDTTEDLKRALANGDTVEETAVFLQFSPETVRAKAIELGVIRRPIIDAIEAIDGIARRRVDIRKTLATGLERQGSQSCC